MNPEDKARERIDRQLHACGWRVQNRSDINLQAGRGRRFVRLHFKRVKPTICFSPTERLSALSKLNWKVTR